MGEKEKNKKIGFCDSGVGGLTVYSKFRKILDTEDCIFFGDLKNSPYGSKTKEQLIGYSRRVFDFFKEQDVKAVVMACNTTSASTYPVIKDEYDFKIYPVIQSCAKILAGLKIKRLGIFATVSTINSGVYESEIKKYNSDMEIFPHACPEWVNIVESNSGSKPENIEIIKNDLEQMMKNKPEKIVLGCTHYPYLLDILSEFAPREMFIDPSQYFVEYIKSDLEKSDLLNPQASKGSEEFFVSANPENFKSASGMFYKVENVKLVESEKISSVR
ncbi:MAG: glutamate racemase [Cyanobacteria bacterium RUI128]|nr:glutamate racemase [Cyanobacteria bacterium RUI128]